MFTNSVAQSIQPSFSQSNPFAYAENLMDHKHFLEYKLGKNIPSALSMTSSRFSRPASFSHGLTNQNMGFVDIILITAAIAASAATSIYGIEKQSKLDEQRLAIEKDLANRRLAIEEKLAAANIRLIEIQTSGLEQTQALTIEVMTARVELEKAKLEFELQQIKREQERMAIQFELEQATLSFEKEQLLQMQEQRLALEGNTSYAINEQIVKSKEIQLLTLESQVSTKLASPVIASKDNTVIYLAGSGVAVALLFILIRNIGDKNVQ